LMLSRHNFYLRVIDRFVSYKFHTFHWIRSKPLRSWRCATTWAHTATTQSSGFGESRSGSTLFILEIGNNSMKLSLFVWFRLQMYTFSNAVKMHKLFCYTGGPSYLQYFFCFNYLWRHKSQFQISFNKAVF